VRKLQACLRTMGLFTYSGGNTGFYGNITRESYQKWLDNYGVSCEVLKKQFYNAGEISPRVRVLQQCMRDRALFDYPTNTGYFGPITTESLRRWRAS
jgi:hypothetical protein